MFVLHLWTAPIWVALMLVVSLTISVLGWSKGRPRWTYPWLGYCLAIPIVSWGLAMSAVGYGAWSVVTSGTLPLGIPIYVASFAYLAFSLWIVIKVVSKVARRDWVMASLAVLPVPFLAYWFFYFYDQGALLQSTGQTLQAVDNSAAIVFLIVALATAIFLPHRPTTGQGRFAAHHRTVHDRACMAQLSGRTGLHGRVRILRLVTDRALDPRAFRPQRTSPRPVRVLSDRRKFGKPSQLVSYSARPFTRNPLPLTASDPTIGAFHRKLLSWRLWDNARGNERTEK